MTSTIERFKADIEKLVSLGGELLNQIQYECFPGEFRAQAQKLAKEERAAVLAAVEDGSFGDRYQRWYSESLAVLKQLLPDRVADFVRLFQQSKAKDLTYANYRIEDFLQGTQVTRGGEVRVSKSAAIPQFKQQLEILKAATARFESSLFDIRHVLQADLLDSEIATAEELAKYKFIRAAGAVAGVVLERHLAQVCADRQVQPQKKNPTISDFNEALKSSSAIDVPQWRFIQHLADIRNLCDHSKVPEPTKDQVDDLVAGVKKVMKTVY